MCLNSQIADKMREKEFEESRHELAPYVGKVVTISARVERYGSTKSLRPQDTMMLKDLVLAEEDVHVDHLWVLGRSLDLDTEVAFTAEVSTYIVYDGDRNAFTKYGLMNIKHVTKHKDDINAGLVKVKEKKMLADNCNRNNPTVAVQMIQEVLTNYGMIMTPSITPEGTWICSVTDMSAPHKTVVMAKNENFAMVIAEARDIIEFFKADYIKTIS